MMPLPKVPKKLLPKLTSVFLLLYVAATLPWFTNRLTSFAYIVQGIVQSGQNAEDEAIATYRQAVQIDPQFAWAYNQLGNALFDKWKFDEAIAAYRQAVQIDPNYANAYKNLGNTLSYQNKPKEAIAAYRQAIQINPNYAAAYSNLGFDLQQLGRLDEAIAAYRQALQIDPNDARAYRYLGAILQKQGKLDEASAAYRQAIKINPNYAAAYSSLGWPLQQQGRLEEAIAAYRQAIKLNLKNAQADNNMEINLLLKETERLLAIRKKPQLLAVSERLPSLKDEPLLLLKRSFVRVIIKSAPQLESGTGWVIKRQGNKAWVVTNRPVETADKNTPQSDRKIEVEFYSEPPSGEFRKRLPAKIVQITAASDKLDLALLEVTNIPKDIKPLARYSASFALNAPIRIVKYSDTTDDWKVATAQVINKYDQELGVFTISDILNPGSPVLDQQNRVLGIVWGLSSLTHSIQTQNQQEDISGSVFVFPIQSVTKQLKNWGID